MTPEEFRALIRRAGLTMDAVAASLNVSRNTVQMWQTTGVPEGRTAGVRVLLATEGRSSETLVNVNVRLSSEMLRRIDEAADADDRSRSQMMRVLLERALA